MAAFQKIGVERIAVDKFLGKSLDQICLDLDLDKEHTALLKYHYLQFDRKNCQKVKYHKEMDQLLKWLIDSGIPLALVTSKLQESTYNLIEALHLDLFFKVIITSADVVYTKPNPEPLLLACKRLKVKPDPSCISVGDTISDINAALSANITPIGVTWGVDGDKLRMAYPSLMTVTSTAELRGFLEQ